MKNLYILVLFIIITGCPAYDPPSGVVEIVNLSPKTIYVCMTCDTVLPKEPGLKLNFTMGSNAYDEYGNSLENKIYYPRYRILADSIGKLGVDGTPNKPAIICKGNSIIFFY